MLNELKIGVRCVGQNVVNKQGCIGVISDYKSMKNTHPSVLVEFSDGHKGWYCKKGVRNGSFKNPYHPSIHGVACLGTKYKKHPLYSRYHCMIGRCYNAKHKDYHLYGKKAWLFVIDGCVLKTL